jgi:hypothetical protein
LGSQLAAYLLQASWLAHISHTSQHTTAHNITATVLHVLHQQLYCRMPAASQHSSQVNKLLACCRPLLGDSCVMVLLLLLLLLLLLPTCQCLECRCLHQ